MMKTFLRFLIGGLFGTAGVLHFLRPEGFTRIVPKYLPLRKTAVYVTGIFEIIFGILLFWKRPCKWTKCAINAFLLAVFPANIYMARKKLPLGDQEVPKWGLYARLPLQFVLMSLVKKL